MSDPTGRRARVFGSLLLTTCHQPEGAPRIDSALITDAEGRRYGALVLGASRRAPVLGWRSWTPPRLPRGASTTWRWLPRSLGAFLFAPRWSSTPIAQSARAGRWLRRLADRVDHPGAPQLTGWSFTYEDGEGLRWRQDRRGCPVAYLGEDAYARAHAEADVPAPRIDWAAVASGVTSGAGDAAEQALRGFLS